MFVIAEEDNLLQR